MPIKTRNRPTHCGLRIRGMGHLWRAGLRLLKPEVAKRDNDRESSPPRRIAMPRQGAELACDGCEHHENDEGNATSWPKWSVTLDAA